MNFLLAIGDAGLARQERRVPGVKRHCWVSRGNNFKIIKMWIYCFTKWHSIKMWVSLQVARRCYILRMECIIWHKASENSFPWSSFVIMVSGLWPFLTISRSCTHLRMFSRYLPANIQLFLYVCTVSKSQAEGILWRIWNPIKINESRTKAASRRSEDGYQHVMHYTYPLDG